MNSHEEKSKTHQMEVTESTSLMRSLNARFYQVKIRKLKN